MITTVQPTMNKTSYNDDDDDGDDDGGGGGDESSKKAHNIQSRIRRVL